MFTNLRNKNISEYDSPAPFQMPSAASVMGDFHKVSPSPRRPTFHLTSAAHFSSIPFLSKKATMRCVEASLHHSNLEALVFNVEESLHHSNLAALVFTALRSGGSR